MLINGKPAQNVEVTYWKNGSSYVFSVLGNPLRLSDEFGGKVFYGKEPSSSKVTLILNRHAKYAIDQSTGKKLGEGKEFTIDWQQPRAAVLSVDF